MEGETPSLQKWGSTGMVTRIADAPLAVLDQLRNWKEGRQERRMARLAIDDGIWHQVMAASPLFDNMSDAAKHRLRDLATQFLLEKRFFGAHGFLIHPSVSVSVAAQACRLVLHLDLDQFAPFRTIIMYPGSFVAEREEEDELGIVHAGYEELDGESMEQGAIVLAWSEAQPSQELGTRNVVMHEFAHKLDEASGTQNGVPILHPEMNPTHWQLALRGAYTRMVEESHRAVSEGRVAATSIDDYATTNPAEFFAVCVEYFFLAPEFLAETLPAVFEQFCAFFHEDTRHFADWIPPEPEQ